LPRISASRPVVARRKSSSWNSRSSAIAQPTPHHASLSLGAVIAGTPYRSRTILTSAFGISTSPG
jgi:hypothetical protein